MRASIENGRLKCPETGVLLSYVRDGVVTCDHPHSPLFGKEFKAPVEPVELEEVTPEEVTPEEVTPEEVTPEDDAQPTSESPPKEKPKSAKKKPKPRS